MDVLICGAEDGIYVRHLGSTASSFRKIFDGKNISQLYVLRSCDVILFSTNSTVNAVSLSRFCSILNIPSTNIKSFVKLVCKNVSLFRVGYVSDQISLICVEKRASSSTLSLYKPVLNAATASSNPICCEFHFDKVSEFDVALN